LQSNSIKYKIHYNATTYDHKTRTYINGEQAYKNFNQARAHQWKCDKCGDTFSKYPDLKEHKKEDHSY